MALIDDAVGWVVVVAIPGVGDVSRLREACRWRLAAPASADLDLVEGMMAKRKQYRTCARAEKSDRGEKEGQRTLRQLTVSKTQRHQSADSKIRRAA
jgi:hypothetical protein